MPEIYQLSRQFRASLLAQEREAASDMVRVYGAVYLRLRSALETLLAKAEQAKDAGEYSASWLYQQQRLETFQKQVLDEIHSFAGYAGETVVAGQRRAVYQAQDHAAQLIDAGMADTTSAGAGVHLTFSRLPTGAVQEIVGHLQDGSPVRELLDSLAPQAATAVRQTLVSGLALGKSPSVISREMRADLGHGLTRTLTISRTETMRAYRESSRQIYSQNAAVVAGWIWVSSLSRRTCAMCLAMHGSWHPLDEPMGSHPNCRCVMVPQTKSRAELGLPESGEDWFERQSEDTQLAVLGPGKLAAYKAGDITLQDLVAYHVDPRWGPMRWEAPLTQALKKDALAKQATVSA